MDRIVIDHRIMGGVPCIRGTRIPVATVLGLLAQGASTAEVLRDYPQIAGADIQACLEFAAAAVDGRHWPLEPQA
jgi:uncharacterized protein (DUF433 family)